MHFDVKALMHGKGMARLSWNGGTKAQDPIKSIRVKKPQWMLDKKQDGDPSGMSLPYIYMDNENRDYVPWTPSQEDLLADDWEFTR